MEQEQAVDHTENLAQAIQDANSETEQSSTEQANFWNPVNFDEILKRFSKTESYNHRYARSFLYQPERISLNSHDAQTPTVTSTTNLYGYTTNGTIAQETFSQFNIIFEKPLLRVKSLQLLSAIIPNPQASIPDDERVFYYYRLRNIYSSLIGIWSSSYTYSRGDVVVYVITGVYYYYISTINTNFFQVPSSTSAWIKIGQAGDNTTPTYPPWNINTTYNAGDVVFYKPEAVTMQTFIYTSVQSVNIGHTPTTSSDSWWTKNIVSVATTPNWFDISSAKVTGSKGGMAYVSLYASATPPELFPPSTYPNATTAKNTTFPDYPTFTAALQSACTSTGSASVANDVSFQYNQTINKIQFVPQNQIGWVNGVWNDGFFYLLVGWNDANLATFQAANAPTQKKYYSLNLRTGFTWNGYFSLPSDPWNGGFGNSVFAGQIANYFTPWSGSGQPYTIFLPLTRTYITANTFADLVFTQSIRVYCDITQGSTQDSGGNAGLLSIIPMAATTLGVTFYQNNFNNPLTKIPEQLQSILIIMKTDSGDDYVLPSSASVSLELGIQYE